MHSNKQQLANILVYIGELYDKSISSVLTNIYWHALKDFAIPDIKQAFYSHINDPDYGRFFPKPADIIRVINGTGETRALQAWTKVAKAIVSVGSYNSVAFDDFLIHAVLDDMGGWIRICSAKEDAMPYLANEFQKRYRGYITRSPIDYPKYLFGIAESENIKLGYPIKSPVLIGDIQQAKQIIANGVSKLAKLNAIGQCRISSKEAE